MKREYGLLFFVLLIKSAALWSIAAFLTRFIPYAGNFPYGEIINEYSPELLRPLSNFDGMHYILIARMGYLTYAQAFFPLFPLFIHLLGNILQHNYLLAGALITNISYIAGTLLLYAVIKQMINKQYAVWFMALYLLFPTSFFFNVIYTESFFLLFVALALFMIVKQQYIAVVALLMASLTRLTGVFLVFPTILFALQKTRKRWFSALTISSPLLGLFSYMAYLWYTTGDPLYFFTSQPAFGANRSTSIILLPQVYYRYARILLTADMSVAYAVAVVEVALFTLMLVAACMEGWYLLKNCRYKKLPLRTGILLFSLSTILLPTLTGTFSSLPRYSLFALSSFIFFVHIKSRAVKIALCGIFAVMQCILAALFIQGYFVS